jgi:hypothetical protein
MPSFLAGKTIDFPVRKKSYSEFSLGVKPPISSACRKWANEEGRGLGFVPSPRRSGRGFFSLQKNNDIGSANVRPVIAGQRAGPATAPIEKPQRQ